MTPPKRKRKNKKKSYFSLLSFILLLLLSIHYYLTPLPSGEKQIKKAVPATADDISEKRQINRNTQYTDLEIPIQNTVSGSNERTLRLRRSGYTLLYNTRKRIPEWVAWELTGKEAKGDGKRTDRFIEDPDIETGTAQNSDYKRSGYDRGHMAPAGDMGWNQKAMEESFFYSNICPQRNALNGGVWKDLEELCRKWAVEDSAIYIVCGPVVGKGYKTIGKNKVVVPQRFFKVILSIYGDRPKAIGFLFENGKTVQPLIDFCVSVDSIEQVTGFDFFSALPDEIENRIESSFSTAEWSWTDKSKRPKRR